MFKLLSSLFTPEKDSRLDYNPPVSPQYSDPPKPKEGSYQITQKIYGSGIHSYELQHCVWSDTPYKQDGTRKNYLEMSSRYLHYTFYYSPFWTKVGEYSTLSEAQDIMAKCKKQDHDNKVISVKVIT